jgi:hypothetical protein
MGGFQLPVEDLIFSGSGGFLFGVLTGYAIKKVMKIAAIIIGHPSVIAISGLPVAAGIGFVPGLMMGLKRG